MKDLEKNYYNTFVGARNFGAGNAADFPEDLQTDITNFE
jgi:hypothetical protein